LIRHPYVHWRLTPNLSIQCYILWIKTGRDGYSLCPNMMHAWNTRQLCWMEHGVARVPIRQTYWRALLLIEEVGESATQTAPFDIFHNNDVQQAISETCARNSELPAATEDRGVDDCCL
jgi:hypothetical protein